MNTALKDMAEHYTGITSSIIVDFVVSLHHLESARNASQKWGNWGKGKKKLPLWCY